MKNLKVVSQQATYWLSVIALGLMVGLSIQFAQAWTNPGAAAPGGNVPGPLTVGASTQTKVGQLNVTAVGDANDGGFYLDPNGTSTVYNFNSSNWAAFRTGTVGWAAGFYDGAWGSNASPANPVGSIYVNDVYLRSVGRWASQTTAGVTSITGGMCGVGQVVKSISATGVVTCGSATAGAVVAGCSMGAEDGLNIVSSCWGGAFQGRPRGCPSGTTMYTMSSPCETSAGNCNPTDSFLCVR